MSSLIIAPPSGTGTDNHIVRWDTSLNLQDSLGIISDTGDLTGLANITLGNITWSGTGDFFNSLATMSFSTTGANDMNFTCGIGGNLNFISVAGQVNIVADLDCTFGSASGAFILTANTASNFTVSTGNLTLESTAANLNLTGATGIYLNDNTHLLANTLFLGAADDAGIFRDGTSLVINPRLVGSVSVNDVVIGSSSASGGNDSNLRVFRMALFGSDILGTAAVNCTVTGALRAALNFVLTMNTGTVAAPFTCNLIDTSTGNNFIMTNVMEYTLNTNSHVLADATKASVLNLSTGINAAITLSPVGTAEDHMLTCLKLVPNGKGVGGAHSNGASTLKIYSTGLFQKKMTAFTGTGTYTYVGGYFGDDLCMESGAKIIYGDNSETDSTTWVKVVKGNYYHAYSTANVALELFAGGTKVQSHTATLNTSEVILRTLSGTSTSYARVGGTINVNTTAVGNVGAGEDDLIAYTVPANTMSVNGDHIEFKVSGTFAANANTKRIRVKFGATTLLDTTALAFNGVDWSAEGTIVRTGATTQKAYCAFRAGATLTSTSDDTAPGETLSGTSVFKVTGEATSNNDIVETFHTLKWFPNA